MKHTPGKWTVEQHGNTHALYCDRDEYHHGLRLMNLGDGDMNFDANASLISAAPDMLEALLVEARNAQIADPALRTHNWDKLKAAIERATGEPIVEIIARATGERPADGKE